MMQSFTGMTSFVVGQAKRLARDESATTAIEYALVATGISVAIIAAVTSLGTTLNDLFFVKVQTALK